MAMFAIAVARGHLAAASDCFDNSQRTAADSNVANELEERKGECSESNFDTLVNLIPSIHPPCLEEVASFLLDQGPTVDLQKDWWDHAKVSRVPELKRLPSLTELRGVEIIHHPGLPKPKKPSPWDPGESLDTYKRLGVSDSKSMYVAMWLNAGACSLLSVSEAVSKQAVEACCCDGSPLQNLKLLIQPIRTVFPFPAKRASNADTVANFFGSDATFHRRKLPGGPDICVLQIDLYAILSVRFALKAFGFRAGNVIDLIIADWPGQAVLLSFRLIVTHAIANFLQNS